MGHASVMLSKLCLMDEEGWDPVYASNTIDFYTTVDTMMAKMNEAKAASEQATLHNSAASSSCTIHPIFESINPKLQQWKELQNYRASQLRQQQRQQRSMLTVSAGTEALPSNNTNDEFLFPGGTSLMDFLDDSFWPQVPTC